MSTAYDFSPPKIDFSFPPAVLDKARELRKAYHRRFDSNPINWSARHAMETAERNAPLEASSTVKNSSSTIKLNSHNTMQDLKNNLSSLRSHRESQFNESVPPSTSESRIRATFATDEITTADRTSSSSSSPPNATRKSALTLNIRPLNTRAFEKERDSACRKADIPVKSEGGGNVHLVRDVKFRLKPDATDDEINAILKIFRSLLPDPSCDEDNGGTPRVEVDGANKYMIWTQVVKDNENDKLQKFLVRWIEESLRLYRRDPFAESAADEAPGFFRLLTARLDIARNLSDWVDSDEASIMKLFEGARLSTEVIIRHDIHKMVHEKFSESILEDFDKKELAEMLRLPLASVAARDTSVDVKMAPIELLYATFIKETCFTDRRIKEAFAPSAIVKSMNDRDAKSDSNKTVEGKCWQADRFSTTAPEEYVSLLVSSGLFLELNSTQFRDRLVCELSRPIAESEYHCNEEEPTVMMIAHLMGLLSRNVDEIVSVNVVSHSFHARIEFEGFGSNIWKFIPKTMQGIVDAAKPIIAACSDDFDRFDDDPRDPNAKFRNMNGTNFETRAEAENYWPNGHFGRRAKQIVETLAPREYQPNDRLHLIIGAQKKRTSAFRIAVVVNSEDKEQQWASVIEAFGGQVFRIDDKKRKFIDDNDSDSDDDEDCDNDDGLELPKPTVGNMRVAYVKHAADGGRYIELVRPNSVGDCEFALALIGTCDAVVVVNALEDIKIMKNGLGDDENNNCDERIRKLIKAPFLFVSTGGKPASPERNGVIDEQKIGNMTAVDYKSLPSNRVAAKSAADGMLSWLVSNSLNPKNGTSAAEPAAPWDFAFENPLTIP